MMEYSTGERGEGERVKKRKAEKREKEITKDNVR